LKAFKQLNLSLVRPQTLHIADLYVFFSASTLLFNTEDHVAANYDCIYYQNSLVKYCIRTNNPVRELLPNICLNEALEFSFTTLREIHIEPKDILQWSSSIEKVDKYAAFLTG
jgi:hypothetical protein